MKTKERESVPTVQIVLLTLSVIIGILIFGLYVADVYDVKRVSTFIMFYSLGIPLVLFLFFRNDMENQMVFVCWLLFSIILCAIYGIAYITEFDLPYQYSMITSSLKTPLIFLLTYAAANKYMHKKHGRRLLNTCHKFSCIDYETNHKIKALDIIFNILIYLITVMSIVI